MYADYYSEENLEDSEICDNFVGWFYVWRYNGHVAMYIGNGKIVHASNRRTGIKISPRANYRRIVCVRRVVE